MLSYQHGSTSKQNNWKLMRYSEFWSLYRWGSKFGTTKCRTTDIMKCQNCEY